MSRRSSISQSNKGHHIDISERNSVFGDSHEGSNIVSVLMDVKKSMLIVNVSNVAQLSIRKVVPIFLLDEAVDLVTSFHWVKGCSSSSIWIVHQCASVNQLEDGYEQ